MRFRFEHVAPALAIIAALTLAGGTRAATYTEVGNAGQMITTAQNVQAGTAGNAITAIFGTLTAGQDADLYKIYLDGSAFSASTVNAYTVAGTSDGGLDTALFLLDGQGHGISTNDDANAFSFQSSLSYQPQSAGFYFLGISNSGNEPVNSASQLLFAGYPGGDTTATRGPASGLNPTTEADFDSNSYTNQAGAYSISLTGVTNGAPATVSAAPEPASWALMLGGVGAMGLALRSRRRQPKLARVTAV